MAPVGTTSTWRPRPTIRRRAGPPDPPGEALGAGGWAGPGWSRSRRRRWPCGGRGSRRPAEESNRVEKSQTGSAVGLTRRSSGSGKVGRPVSPRRGLDGQDPDDRRHFGCEPAGFDLQAPWEPAGAIAALSPGKAASIAGRARQRPPVEWTSRARSSPLRRSPVDSRHARAGLASRGRRRRSRWPPFLGRVARQSLGRPKVGDKPSPTRERRESPGSSPNLSRTAPLGSAERRGRAGGQRLAGPGHTLLATHLAAVSDTSSCPGMNCVRALVKIRTTRLHRWGAHASPDQRLGWPRALGIGFRGS
jgi:hypothetical protein